MADDQLLDKIMVMYVASFGFGVSPIIFWER